MNYLYVCRFSNGHIKVGRSINDPATRINSHAERVACLGVDLTDSFRIPCADKLELRELNLIRSCASRATKRNNYEWFEGLDYVVVCDLARAAATDEIDGADSEAAGWPEYINQVRRCGYTQQALAALLGVAQTSISDAMNGKTTNVSFRIGYGLLQIGRKHGLSDPVSLFPIQETA